MSASVSATRRACGLSQDALRGFFELRKGNRFHQVVARAFLHGEHGFRDASVGGQKDHRGLRRDLPHALHHVQPVAVAHAHVGDHQAARGAAELGQRLGHSAGCGHLPSAAAEVGVQRGAHGSLVVYHQHLAHADPF
jgi:hypothetical protein